MYLRRDEKMRDSSLSVPPPPASPFFSPSSFPADSLRIPESRDLSVELRLRLEFVLSRSRHGATPDRSFQTRVRCVGRGLCFRSINRLVLGRQISRSCALLAAETRNEEFRIHLLRRRIDPRAGRRKKKDPAGDHRPGNVSPRRRISRSVSENDQAE